MSIKETDPDEGSPDEMSDQGWVSARQYTDFLSASVAASLLSGLGIPNEIYSPRSPDFRSGECYLWVPPELAQDAKKALEQAPLSEKELTELALKYPPPDDA